MRKQRDVYNKILKLIKEEKINIEKIEITKYFITTLYDEEYYMLEILYYSSKDKFISLKTSCDSYYKKENEIDSMIDNILEQCLDIYKSIIKFNIEYNEVYSKETTFNYLCEVFNNE